MAARPLIGHGLAMARTGARPVVGHVRVCQDTHAWESVMTPDVPVDAVAVAAPKLEAFAAGLRDPERMLTLVERFAIRAALCAGDVPAPVNSQYASAWELREGDTELADLAAWYVVRHMAGGIRGWL
ncbi:hypothetical protein QUV83_05605 [Cellulomonas cellasea]|uniref:hypothetical protein n=1 Tax=Cellulomonas cellasea TaxID=43670 RepID=UPI0025A3D163|nr:hypothetical protein [Cellulomonas cellasea]MDM8084233.1 hypothetical protein [Cellulomonas cellasea]